MTFVPYLRRVGPLAACFPAVNLQGVEVFGLQQEEQVLRRLWLDEQGQDIAEYAVMLSVILAIVVGTIRLIGSNANNVFSMVGSTIQ